MRVEVDTTGRTSKPVVVRSTNKKLNSRALQLAREYRFAPAEIAGKKVVVSVVIPIQFSP